MPDRSRARSLAHGHFDRRAVEPEPVKVPAVGHDAEPPNQGLCGIQLQRKARDVEPAARPRQVVAIHNEISLTFPAYHL